MKPLEGVEKIRDAMNVSGIAAYPNIIKTKSRRPSSRLVDHPFSWNNVNVIIVIIAVTIKVQKSHRNDANQ